MDSPFPERIYFILNLGHFFRLFDTSKKMVEKLVWLPAWHQTRILCQKYGVEKEKIVHIWGQEKVPDPGEEILLLYEELLKSIQPYLS